MRSNRLWRPLSVAAFLVVAAGITSTSSISRIHTADVQPVAVKPVAVVQTADMRGPTLDRAQSTVPNPDPQRSSVQTASAVSVGSGHPNLNPVPILMYHSISVNPKNSLCVAPSLFEEQMRYLHDNGYHSVKLDDVVEYWQGTVSLPSRPIVITFDDGYLDNYTNAYPVLKKFGLNATLFLVPDFVGGPNFVTWDEAKEMNDSSVFAVESHTMDHLDLTHLNPTQLKHQVDESKTVIEQHLNKTVTDFCYPSGRYNEAVIDAVKSAGYVAATTTKPGWASPVTGDDALHRVRVSGLEPLSAFIQQVEYK